MSNLAEALEAALDRREYPRVPVALPAQLSIPEKKKIWSARVTNLSAGGAGLQFSDKPPSADLIGTLAIDGFGDFSGITTRRQGDTAGLRFLVGEAERHQLLQCLTVFIRSGLQSVSSFREIGQSSQPPVLSLTRQSGRQHQCKVEEISFQGVALSMDIAIPHGEHVFVGQMFGRVIDGQQDQVMVQFLRYSTAHPAPLLESHSSSA